MTTVARRALFLLLVWFHNGSQAYNHENSSNGSVIDKPGVSPRILQGNGQLRSPCTSDSGCNAGLYCFACLAAAEIQPKCVRRTVTPTSAFPKNTSLPFDNYAWLTTHNSYSIFGSTPQAGVPIITFFNQEDSVLEQLNNGVRGLMLDLYDFRNDIWLCHSFQGHCYDFTAFRPANKTLAEIKTFLDANPTEVITIFIEDYVHTQKGITRLFTNAGLIPYWMPVAMMPSNGTTSWPTLAEMIERNHRLLVFTQNATKEATEGVAYQWSYTTENQFGDGGIRNASSCPKRNMSAPLSDENRTLIVQNYFPTNPNYISACWDNSDALFNMLKTCFAAAGNRWSNYIALDFYKRSTGGGAFSAIDFLNGQMQCSCQDATKNCCGNQTVHQNRK